MLKMIVFCCVLMMALYATYLNPVQKTDSTEYVKKAIPLLYALAVSLLASSIYDIFIKPFYSNADISITGPNTNYPYFVEVDENYGNFMLGLEQKGNLSLDGLEVSIAYPNTQYFKVMIWDYSEPVWFNIQPSDYEVAISKNGDLLDKYPISVKEDYVNTVTLPVH